jgi:hypothetical protein
MQTSSCLCIDAHEGTAALASETGDSKPKFRGGIQQFECYQTHHINVNVQLAVLLSLLLVILRFIHTFTLCQYSWQGDGQRRRTSCSTDQSVWNTKIHCLLQKPVQSQLNPGYTLAPNFLKTHLPPFHLKKIANRFPKWSPPSRFSDNNCRLYISHPYHSFHMSSPSHSPSFVHANNIWSIVQTIKLITEWFSLHPCLLYYPENVAFTLLCLHCAAQLLWQFVKFPFQIHYKTRTVLPIMPHRSIPQFSFQKSRAGAFSIRHTKWSLDEKEVEKGGGGLYSISGASMHEALMMIAA